MEYAERLTVPLRWWVQGTMLVAALWLAVVVAVPTGPAAPMVAVVAAVVVGGGFLAYGAARVEVGNGEFRAGRAHIPLVHLGEAEPLDPAGTRRVAGVDADARAHLVLRPYLHRSVRVRITDPADPTPYWLVSTRHPDRLVAALASATTGRDATGQGASG